MSFLPEVQLDEGFGPFCGLSGLDIPSEQVIYDGFKAVPFLFFNSS
jgi:hypothetical protein